MCTRYSLTEAWLLFNRHGPRLIQTSQSSDLVAKTTTYLTMQFRRFRPAKIAGVEHRTLGIVVPSRLQSQPTEAYPLQDMRIGVKDIFSLKGMHTALNNKAFQQLYAAQNLTSSAISRLLDAGAQIIGKTQMSAFALQEHPTQSVEYTSAFNPRADGYQIPTGSSSGSAAAVASYEWLDVTLGTDSEYQIPRNPLNSVE